MGDSRPVILATAMGMLVLFYLLGSLLFSFSIFSACLASGWDLILVTVSGGRSLLSI
jgi:hypothetical protein